MVNARFEVLTAGPMKIQLFWNFTPFRLVNSYRSTWRNILRDLILYAIQEFPRFTPNPKTFNVPSTRLHSQPDESHHTTTHNTDIVVFSVSVGSKTTMLHPHTLLHRMRGGEDDDVDDDHTIQITDKFLHYLNKSS